METPLHAAIAGLLLCALAGCRTTETQGPPQVILQNREGQPLALRVEVVSRPEDLARGLMHRERLAADAGMLFVYPDEDQRSFWMKNTLIPLDMLFIGSNLRVVGVVENAVPLSLEPRTVDAPARFVLEVQGGFVKRHGIRLGSLVRLAGVPGLSAAR
ncbi:MAG TPA: DUF192 domain-containing protein [Myxococcota bacterium]|nr:DUF192 domain-containing protein [Myxococcota bacterium]HRY95994.1 DUF192 domain-containing protein [Myxococcota bacterium]HSA21790.1 DUF192 domain-containing protein [Myxococcota bacterium]